MSKIVVVTAANKKFKYLCQMCIDSIKDTGYEVLVYDLGELGFGKSFKGRVSDVANAKIPGKPEIIQDALEQVEFNDYVVWMDADTILWDTLEDIRGDWDIGVTARTQKSREFSMPINAGVVMVKKTPWALEFVEQWVEQCKNGISDQQELNCLCKILSTDVGTDFVNNGKVFRVFSCAEYNNFYFKKSQQRAKITHYKSSARGWWPRRALRKIPKGTGLNGISNSTEPRFKPMKIVLVTGGFDPLHSGHIRMFEEARDLGHRLIVGVNSDAWLTRKKGRPFMPLSERVEVIRALGMVDVVVAFDDDYDADDTCKRFIEDSCWNYEEDDVIFANGGDRTTSNIPEMSVVAENLYFEFGVGGTEKANSSSWILAEWKAPKIERQWGYYRVLHEDSGVKVKELTVDPGCSLSFQRHFERNEYWLVSEGTATVATQMTDNHPVVVTQKQKHQNIHISMGSWHQLSNQTDEPLKIVEIQYGENCIEEDIERKS
jgi:cytidyltransferase-like protein